MPRKNLLVMICHDLGDVLNCYGHDTVNSPNIDRLASEGVLLENYYCTAPTCSPSRASIWTGRYPHSTGMLGLIHGPLYWKLNSEEKHLAQYFKEKGYRTALFGDQHVHYEGGERLGFDFDKPGKDEVNPVCERSAGFLCDYLKEYDGAQPFFFQIGFVEPHRPFGRDGTPPDDEKGVAVPGYLPDCEAARREFAEYQGSIKRLDAAVGSILEALDNSPHAENTTVVFTTDHGSPFPRAKMNLYDPGLRTVCIVRDPELTDRAGARCPETISNVDFTPTMIDLFGLEPKDDLHGRSFAGLLAGSGDYEPRDKIFATQTYHGPAYLPMRAVRTARYKYIVNFDYGPEINNTKSDIWTECLVDDPKYNRQHARFELYDLEKDPWEFDNLAGRPEVYDVEKRLDSELRDYMRRTDDPLLKGVPPTLAYHEAMKPRWHQDPSGQRMLGGEGAQE